MCPWVTVCVPVYLCMSGSVCPWVAVYGSAGVLRHLKILAYPSLPRLSLLLLRGLEGIEWLWELGC